MQSIETIVNALNERTVAAKVGLLHDETRLRYPLTRNTVKDFDEFMERVIHYTKHHYSNCISKGAPSDADAWGRAKEIIERAYRRRNGDIRMAYMDAHDGMNGGVRGVLDIIADGFKEEAIANYVSTIFDTMVAPTNWQEKVNIIREFINRCGVDLSSSINPDEVERYANDYRVLIEGYCQALKPTASKFRSL